MLQFFGHKLLCYCYFDTLCASLFCTFFTFQTKRKFSTASHFQLQLINRKNNWSKMSEKVTRSAARVSGKRKELLSLASWVRCSMAFRMPSSSSYEKTNVKYTALYHSFCRLAHRSNELIGCCLETGFKVDVKRILYLTYLGSSWTLLWWASWQSRDRCRWNEGRILKSDSHRQNTYDHMSMIKNYLQNHV